jgi:hypothetical protein
MPFPKGIDIPGCFAAYNMSFAQGFTTGMRQFLSNTNAMGKKSIQPGDLYKMR